MCKPPPSGRCKRVPRDRRLRVALVEGTTAVAIIVALLRAADASAQAPAPAAAPAAADGESPESPDSPRAAVAEFLRLTRAGDYGGAARYLALAPPRAAEGPRLAERLRAVLDRWVALDLERLSPAAEGRRDDGLPAWTEEIGSIPIDRSLAEPVRLVHRGEAGEPSWVFSRATVSRIDGWYDRLPDRFIRDHLPRAFLRPGPLDLRLWQWLALPVLLLLSLLGGRVLGAGFNRLLKRAFERTRTLWDDILLERLIDPLSVALSLLLGWGLMRWLSLGPGAEAGAFKILRALGLATFFWALWRTVDTLGSLGETAEWAQGDPSAKSLLHIGRNVGKVVVATLGVVTALSQLGYPVASLIAGLGIGGLAVAMAARPTIENFFGSIVIGVDKPFRVGDFVKVGDVRGVVEYVGLRSTRLRTPDRTVVTIPNGRMADMQSESFAARDRMRLFMTLSLVHETTSEQVREVLAGLRTVLAAQPKLWPEAVVVTLREIGPVSLDIEISVFFLVEEPEFLAIRQEVLLGFLEVVERAGTRLAVPARDVRIRPAGAPLEGAPIESARP